MWNPFRKQRPKLGLALGSGGAKGIVHIGALKAFSEYGITFDVVTGTSIGSIIGAAYAAGKSWQEMLDAISGLDVSSIKKKGFFSQLTMTDSGNVRRAVAPFLGEETEIGDLRLPYAAVAVDLVTGEEAVLTEGNLADAVTASSAMVPAFSPYVVGEKHLIDGAYLNPIPADVARALGAEIVISVDLSAKKSARTDSVKMFDVMLTSVKIAMKNATYKGYHNSDYVIHPDLNAFSSSKFEGMEEMFQIGYEETVAAMPEILSILKEHHFPLRKTHQEKTAPNATENSQ